MPVAFSTTGSEPACPSRLDAFVLGVWVTAVFLARRIQQYNQYIRHSSSTFLSTNSPSRAHCDNFAGVQATDTDPHRYLLLAPACLLQPNIGPPRHSLISFQLSPAHSLDLRGFCVSCSCTIVASLPKLLVGPLTPRRAFTGAHAR